MKHTNKEDEMENEHESMRRQVIEIRDLAVQAAEGVEASAQKLYPAYGSMTRDQFSGLAAGLNTWLSNMP
jgi:hypothetical protein